MQVTDIPPVTATVTEHRMHRVCCGCGLTSTAPAPPEAAGGASRVYGPNLRALVVYLLAYQQLPIERAARLIADVTGAAPSVGFVHGMLARFAAAVADVVALIETLITAAHVAHFDETTLRSGPAGTRRYVLSAGTSDYTAFHLGGAISRASPASVSCPASPVSRSTTATAPMTTPASPSVPTSSASRICCVTSRTPPRPTPTLTGPTRPPARCVP